MVVDIDRCHDDLEQCEDVYLWEVGECRDGNGGRQEMGVREAFLEERYQCGLWICSSEDKMLSRVPNRRNLTSEDTMDGASWWAPPAHSGKFRRGSWEKWGWRGRQHIGSHAGDLELMFHIQEPF